MFIIILRASETERGWKWKQHEDKKLLITSAQGRLINYPRILMAEWVENRKG